MESTYNAALYFNAFLTMVTCLAFAERAKLAKNGHFVVESLHVMQLFGTVVSTILTAGNVGALFREWLSPTPFHFREHWFLLIIFLVGGAYFSVTKLNDDFIRARRRQSALFVLKEYPHTPVLTMKRMEKFCRKHQLEVFPIYCLKKYIKKNDESGDVVGNAFTQMSSKMNETKCRKRATSEKNYYMMQKKGAFDDPRGKKIKC